MGRGMSIHPDTRKIFLLRSDQIFLPADVRFTRQGHLKTESKPTPLHYLSTTFK